MPVCSQYGIFDHMADDLAARDIAGINLLPIGQKLSGQGLVATVQGIANIGEVVAELPKPQCQLQNQDVPHHGCGPTEEFNQ